MSYCTNCGTKTQEDAAFCSGCGTRLVSGVAADQPGADGPAQFETSAAAAMDAVKAQSSFPERAASLIGLFFTSLPAFLIVYLVAMVPTYILPYLGSNSVVLNAAAAAAGLAGTLPFWMHLGFLWILVSCAMFRGVAIERNWLPVLPLVAAAFDMLPGLNLVPFVPTALHVATLILGSNRQATADRSGKPRLKLFVIAAAGIGLTFLGAIWQVATLDAALFDDNGSAQSDARGADGAMTPEMFEAAPEAPPPVSSSPTSLTPIAVAHMVGTWEQFGERCCGEEAFNPTLPWQPLTNGAGERVTFAADGTFVSTSPYSPQGFWTIDGTSVEGWEMYRVGIEIDGDEMIVSHIPSSQLNAYARLWRRVDSR